MGITVLSDGQNWEGPLKSPASPHQASGTEQRPRDRRVLAQGHRQLEAHAGLDSGLPDPRPVEPLCLLPRGRASQDLLLSARLGRRAVAAGHKHGLVPWDGVPLGPAVGGQDPRGKPRAASCLFPWLCLCEPRSPGLLLLPQAGPWPPLPSPFALGPLRGPVVCSVEWKIPPRPS